jgi:hypothetical protein
MPIETEDKPYRIVSDGRMTDKLEGIWKEVVMA